MKIREAARNYLCGYQLCLDMLKLRKYERKRAAKFDELCDCEDILVGDEAYWKARIYEIAAFLGKMKNGREKMLLYYRYVKGESVEHAASLLGPSVPRCCVTFATSLPEGGRTEFARLQAAGGNYRSGRLISYALVWSQYYQGSVRKEIPSLYAGIYCSFP